MEQHKTLIFQGRKIHYRDEGRENLDTVVFLHGYMQNLDVWASYMLSYMHSKRVIAIDLPGHGFSDNYADVHTMDFMARAVKAVLDDLGVSDCVMVGHSMGGYVSLAFAEAYPYLMRGLVLLHSHAMADDEQTMQKREEACKQMASNMPGYILSFIQTLFDTQSLRFLSHDIHAVQELALETSQQGALAAQKGMLQRPSRLHVLRSLDAPVLCVYGKNDVRLPVELGISQALEARNPELLLLSNVAHMAHIEAREYLKPRLYNFISTCFQG